MNNSASSNAHFNLNCKGASDGENNNNVNFKTEDRLGKGGGWADLVSEEILGLGGRDDSGNFTASPETGDNSGYSGSSRDHSPLSIILEDGRNQTFSSTPRSAFMVQRVTGNRYQESGAATSPPMSSASVSVVISSPNDKIEINPLLDNHPEKVLTDEEVEELSSGSSGYLQTVLDNFNSLYKDKLKMIEDSSTEGDSYTKQIAMEKKASILECWAKDVCVQNIVLIHTVEELEKQADQKLQLLQEKICESSDLAKKHMKVVLKYENQVRMLMNETNASNETQKILRRDLEKIQSDFRRLQEQNDTVEKENDSLVCLVTRIRDMGVWDIEGLEFHKRTYERLFGLYPNLPGSEVQTVFTREKRKKMLATEQKADNLEKEVEELRTWKENTQVSVEDKRRKIAQLEAELSELSDKMQLCRTECERFKNSLIEAQEKLLEASKELQALNKKSLRPLTPNPMEAATRYTDIQELLHELRDVKSQLSASVSESHCAKEETNLIRREFNERLQSMQKSQECFTSEIAHSLDNQTVVREQAAELCQVKEQIIIYQTKYESAEQLINKKDKIIEDLQKQVEQLNEKLSDIKKEWKRVFHNLDATTEDLDDPVCNESSKIDTQVTSPGVDVHMEYQCRSESESRLRQTSESEDLVCATYKKEYEAVREKIEAEYKKELSDKDIEITMQKDDAYGKDAWTSHFQAALLASLGNVGVAGSSNNGLLELINDFENLKTSAIKQLEDLKFENNQVTEKSIWLEKQILLIQNVLAVKDKRKALQRAPFQRSGVPLRPSEYLQPAVSSNPSITRDMNADSFDPNFELSSLFDEVQKLKSICHELGEHCEAEKLNVSYLTSVDNKVKLEINDTNRKLGMFQNLSNELQSELTSVKKELVLVQEENMMLRRTKDQIESELLAIRMGTVDLIHSSKIYGTPGPGYYSPLQRLKILKESFDKNEQIIMDQEQKLLEKDKQIDQYKSFCKKQQKIMQKQESLQKMTEDYEKNFDYLESAARLIDFNNNNLAKQRDYDSESNSDAASFCKSQERLKIERENNSLKNTISSLNTHIEDLIAKNEDVLNQVTSKCLPKYSLDSFADSVSSTASFSPALLMLPIQDSSVEIQGSGDMKSGLKELTSCMRMSDKGEGMLSLCKEKIAAQDYDYHSKLLFRDLARMTTCAERLGRTSEEIITSTLRLHEI